MTRLQIDTRVYANRVQRSSITPRGARLMAAAHDARAYEQMAEFHEENAGAKFYESLGADGAYGDPVFAGQLRAYAIASAEHAAVYRRLALDAWARVSEIEAEDTGIEPSILAAITDTEPATPEETALLERLRADGVLS